MRYDIKSLAVLFLMIVLAIAVIKLLNGIISLLVPAALLVIAGVVIYKIIKKK